MGVASFESGSSFPPLPPGEGGDNVIRSARFIDVEIIGLLSAGEINADNITSGTLSADRIAAGTLTADKLNVTTLSAITASMGTLTVDSTLTMGGSGIFRTATSGQRVEIATASSDRINFYSGDGSEIAPGFISVSPTEFRLSTPRFALGVPGGILWNSAGMLFTTGNPNAGFYDMVDGVTNGATLRLRNAIGWTGGTVEFGSPSSRIMSVIGDASLIYDAAGQGHNFKVGGSSRFTVASSIITAYVDIRRGTNDYSPRLRDGASFTSPGYTFYGDTGTGMYRISASRLGFAAGGNLGLEITSSLLGSMFVYNSTTGDAANVNVNTSGFLQQSTSARKYKTRINYNINYLADYELKPAKFYRKDDKAWYLGFIADDLADENKLLGTYDNDGEVESYDLRAVMAVAVAKINRLEKQVEELTA